ncbi:hypothetical protein REPUB_Repub20aG0084300 [Reevesia pubescens]
MVEKDLVSWSAMISGYDESDQPQEALKLFNELQVLVIRPDQDAMLSVIAACAHLSPCKAEEGRKIFGSMINEHKIAPKHEHHGCMVDPFGRANLLREAIEIVETMPLAPKVVIWGSLMAACQLHGETGLGEFAAKRLLEQMPAHDGALVLLSNIYAKERKWKDVGELRQLMKEIVISKDKGCSRIELNKEVHEFLVADRNHQQADEIYEKLVEVVSQLKPVGYAFNTRTVLVDLEKEEKREVVPWHSENLGLCYGLINGGKDSCIWIVKNLAMRL